MYVVLAGYLYKAFLLYSKNSIFLFSIQIKFWKMEWALFLNKAMYFPTQATNNEQLVFYLVESNQGLVTIRHTTAVLF